MICELGVGVVGVGVMGTLRIATILDHPHTTLCAVADVDSTRTRPWARRTRTTTDYRQLVEDPAIHVVVVSTPAHLHEAVAIAALESGKHVLCEKPLATTVDACARMVTAARRHERILAVGFTHRYYPCFRFLREVLDTGILGPLDHMRVSGGHLGPSGFREVWEYEKTGGGVMMDIGLHMTDLVRFLAADIVRANGTTGARIWQVDRSEDRAMALFDTASGVPIAYQDTWDEWKGYRLCVDLYGTVGAARGYYGPMFNLLAVQDTAGRRRRRFKWYLAQNLGERLRGWQTTVRRACAAELDDLLRRLDGETVSLGSGVDGLRALQVAAAVYESAERRTAVSLALD
ncbi:MAG: Gfo/Idh/MocA family oxidoreductase [Acidobacteriota bacterium]|nr:Gfo/Idh/MocA family oxidoreductase [Acidobacteriota bacterium]